VRHEEEKKPDYRREEEGGREGENHTRGKVGAMHLFSRGKETRKTNVHA